MSVARAAGVVAAGAKRSVAAAFYGIEALSTADRYEAATGTYDPGSASGTILAALVTPRALTSGAGRVFVSCWPASGGGYEINLSPVDAFRGHFVNGVGALVTAPQSNLLAGDLEKVELLIVAHTGSLLRFYRKRLEVGAGTAITGYTVPSGPLSVGTRPGGGAVAASGIAIHGWAIWRGTASLAEIQSYYDAVKSARGLVATLGSLTSVNRSPFPAGAPASVADVGSSGTATLTRVGTPTQYSTPSETWSW